MCELSKHKLETIYGWEISTQDEFGVYSSYVKLTDNTLFSYVNQSVLETIYYRHKFRVRCTTQLMGDTFALPILKSNTVEILRGGRTETATNKNKEKKCQARWEDKETNLMGQKSVVSMQSLEKVNRILISLLINPLPGTKVIQRCIDFNC